ncbi:MAG: RtcB family protein [Planctomycetes bacterium]|nr:RtcB family protein [Planctomycetota bacterium]
MPDALRSPLELGDAAARVRGWTRGVPVEEAALQQLRNTAALPVVGPWVAAMPDVHLGYGVTVGSVVPTRGAVIPAAVGVDIGCGMMAVRTTLSADDLPDDLRAWRRAIERAVPHGRSAATPSRDQGSWTELPKPVQAAWRALEPRFEAITGKHPKVGRQVNHVHHLGTLGTGNHFIEVCLDLEQRVWFMLHSGSRGVGNRIGSYFIERAKEDMGDQLGGLPDKDLAYLREGSPNFEDYVEAVGWAQDYARRNRELMMAEVAGALRRTTGVREFRADVEAVDCHHNYVQEETHFGERLFVARKGAVRAGLGELGIIPGSMGARSFVVRGKGNADSFCSCSHGAGRVMSRGQARRTFSLADHQAATAGVECRKDIDVIDETPGAYKPIDEVMAAQRDLVEVVHELRQVICVKG